MELQAGPFFHAIKNLSLAYTAGKYTILDKKRRQKILSVTVTNLKTRSFLSLNHALVALLIIVTFFKPVPPSSAGSFVQQIAIITPVLISLYILFIYLL